MIKLGAKALEDRIAKLREELKGIEDKCLAVEAKRDVDLDAYETELDIVRRGHETLLEKQKQDFVVAENLRKKGETLIVRGKALLDAAAGKEALAQAMDLGVSNIKAGEKEKAEREKYWAAELAKVQDAKTRRKRTELAQAIEKLERRAKNKAVPTLYKSIVQECTNCTFWDGPDTKCTQECRDDKNVCVAWVLRSTDDEGYETVGDGYFAADNEFDSTPRVKKGDLTKYPLDTLAALAARGMLQPGKSKG